ncbi:MAG: DUF4340 domain-containing protein, partial [Nitrospinota bacterium]
DGAARYVRVSGRQGLVTADAGEVNRLNVTSLKLRDRRLLAFEPEAARRLEVTGPAQNIALWKDGPVWQLTKPDRRELKEGHVRAFIWALKRLKFSGVVEERRTGEPTGEILLEARIWTDAATPQRLSVLRASDETGGAPLAVTSAKPGLYTADEADLEKVEKEVERLLTRTE